VAVLENTLLDPDAV